MKKISLWLNLIVAGVMTVVSYVFALGCWLGGTQDPRHNLALQAWGSGILAAFGGTFGLLFFLRYLRELRGGRPSANDNRHIVE